VRGRLEAVAAARGLTPFVGREDELRLLMNRWERALDGEGQVALIIGEAGIGKSRLVQRFHEQIAGTPHNWTEAATAPFFQNTPFYPVADLVKQIAGLSATESAEATIELLERSLEAAGLKPAEGIPLIAPLLNLTISAKYPPSPLSPEQQRRRLLATLVEWLLGAARVGPLVITIEDLHWADPSTLELIQLLVEQGATMQLMLLYTARPEFQSPWSARAHHTTITLDRLNAHDVRTMVGQFAAQKVLSDETIAVVVGRTGGVPLFVEELTRTVLESGGRKLSEREIPATLHDSLMARLDRLGPAKEIIQIGAVIGREFSYELLHALHPIAEAELQRALRTLADAELLYVRGIAPDATYQFKHALIQDAAYEALLKSRRKELHRLVAHTIDEKFPPLKETQPEVLARHWTEAGETESAIAEWSRAGKAAEARNAFKEARESYQQAVAQLRLLPESPERDLRELKLRQSVIAMLYVMRGYSAPETMEATERAAVLAEKSGNLKQLVISMLGRSVAAHTSGDLPTAAKLLDQALGLALREGSPTRLASVYTLQILTGYWSGDLAGAEKHFTAGLKFFDAPGFRQSPTNGVIAAFGAASWNAWLLGCTDIACEREVQMRAAANGNNPNHLAYSGYCAAQLRVYMREYEQAEALAAGALELAEKHQFPRVAGLSRYVLGHARAQLGRPSQGLRLIREGMAGLLEVGERVGITNFTAYLAEAQERDGSIVDAIETVERALQENPDELAYRPEVLRMRGELQLKQGRVDLAENDFRESIALALTMGARSWELRATTSLARLLNKQGRHDEARAMLADIYNWFTEGFDTADLKDAKALLDELAT
jgi:tetratricopeptide (TPR) repeat protein